MLKRHEGLRTKIVTYNNVPRQVILDVNDEILDIEFIDIRNKELNVEALIRYEQKRIFDLCNGPLIVSKLIHNKENQHVLLLNFHHIITDGWSMEVFIREILQLYDHYANKKDLNLPDLRIQYKDYSVWQNSELNSDSRQMQEAALYWKTKFYSGMNPVRLLTDFPPPAQPSFEGSVQFVPIEKDLGQWLKKAATLYSVSNLCIALTTVKILLQKYSGVNNVLVGTPISGRDHPDVEGLIGIFLNLLPLSTEIDPNDTFSNTIARVKATLFEAYRYQNYPYEKIVEDIRRDSPASSNSFNILVQFAEANEADNQLVSDLAIEFYPFTSQSSQFEITFFFSISQDDLSLKIEYQKELFEKSTIQKLGKDLCHLMSVLSKNSQINISEISLTENQDDEETELFLRTMQATAK